MDQWFDTTNNLLYEWVPDGINNFGTKLVLLHLRAVQVVAVVLLQMHHLMEFSL